MKNFFGKRRGRPLRVLAMVVVWAALFGAVVWLVMVLWNWLMPALFVGARSVNYLQSLALVVLSKILFQGGHGGWRRRHRWDNMSEDERQQIRRQFKNRWGDRWSRSCDDASAAAAAPSASGPVVGKTGLG